MADESNIVGPIGRSRNIFIATIAGTGELSHSFEPECDFTILGVMFRYTGGAGGVGSFKMQLDSYLGSEFDFIFVNEDLSAKTDYVISNENMRPISNLLNSEDKVLFTWPNANNRSWALAIYYIPTNI